MQLNPDLPVGVHPLSGMVAIAVLTYLFGRKPARGIVRASLTDRQLVRRQRVLLITAAVGRHSGEPQAAGASA